MLCAQIFHDFFYQDKGFKHGRSAVSFKDNNFYSYNTQIARKYRNENGVEYLFISDSYFSHTTAQHRSKLLSACPYGAAWVIEVPFDWDDDFSDSFGSDGGDKRFIKTMRKRLEDKLTSLINDYKKDGLPQYRKELREIAQEYERFMRVLEIKITKPVQKKIDSLDDLLRLDSDIVKRRRARLRQEREIERARIEKELKEAKKLLDTYGLLKMVEYAYYSSRITVDVKLIDACEDALSKLYPGKGWADKPAFIFFKRDEPDMLQTTKSVDFPAKLALAYMRRWKRGDNMGQGTKIGPYTIRSLGDKFVQIGCHKIPLDNINALYELLEKKYEKNPEPVCVG